MAIRQVQSANYNLRLKCHGLHPKPSESPMRLSDLLFNKQDFLQLDVQKPQLFVSGLPTESLGHDAEQAHVKECNNLP